MDTVFISSTFLDLQSHRKAVWELLAKFDVTVRGMEQFGARTETPLQTCLHEVEQSDIYVGIIGFRLGTVDPDTGKSYTQIEYERAQGLSRHVFIYLADEENTTVPYRYIDKGNALDKLDAFKRVLRERHTVDTYTTPADLVKKLDRDLRRHLSLREPAAPNADEFAAAKASIETFLLMPRAVAGTEVRLQVRVASPPYPASRAICDAFNLEFGATVGVEVEVIRPEGVSNDLDLLFGSKHAAEVLPISKGDTIDGYMKLHFHGQRVASPRARFRNHTEYPGIASISMSSNLFGKPIHHEADANLGLELSRIIRIERGASAA